MNQFLNNTAPGFDDVCLIPNYSECISRKNNDEVNIKADNYNSPIIAAPMMNVATPKMSELFARCGLIPTTHRFFKNDIAENQYDHYTSDDSDPMKYFWSVGSILKEGHEKQNEKHIENLICKFNVDKFIVDLAHGDSIHTFMTVDFIKEWHPDALIIVGNVATYSAFKALADAGVYGVRVGIGSGSACSTYVNTGFGCPTLYSIMEANRAKESGNYKTKIIADGGIRNAGDIAKSIAAGADFAMTGKILAGSSLAGGTEYVNLDGQIVPKTPSLNYPIAYKEYFGMASRRMLEVHGHINRNTFSDEGEVGLIQYLGETSDVIQKLHNNLKSALSYAGCKDWDEFRKNVTIQRISSSGHQEKKVNLDKVFSI